MSRPWRCAIAGLLLITACTADADGTSTRSVVASSTTATPDGPRLLVQRTDGNIVTTDPDGGSLIPLTTGASPTTIETQAVGSPNGRSIAWVEIDRDGASLETASRTGAHHLSQPLQIAPFYLEWDPTSSKVLYLGNAGPTIGMGIVDAAVVQPTDVAVGGGAPFYLSWSPDGQSLLVHVGTDVLGTTDLTHPLDRIARTPGTFQAPVWLPDGGLVYVIRRGQQQTLVVDREGELQTIATFGGGALFTVDPSGRRIAYRIDRPDGSQVGVFVRAITGGPVHTATSRETTNFFWSPDGTALLLMTPEADAANERTHRWRLWDGREQAVSPPFVPSDTYFTNYAPFFDQYAQSMTPWAPDGSAFAFAGTVGGKFGVWVQQVDGSEPTYAGDGEVVSWLPDDAA